jgi:hypothetical protein
MRPPDDLRARLGSRDSRRSMRSRHAHVVGWDSIPTIDRVATESQPTSLSRVVTIFCANFRVASASGEWRRIETVARHSPPATRTRHSTPPLGCGCAALVWLRPRAGLGRSPSGGFGARASGTGRAWRSVLRRTVRIVWGHAPAYVLTSTAAPRFAADR